MRTKGGVLLKEYRKAKELTQRELSRVMGCTQTACHEWEKGTRKPGAKRARLLEEVTGGAVPAASWLEPVAHQSVSPESIPGVPC